MSELEDIPIFQGIPSEGLERLQREARQRVFPRGSELMRQGDPSNSLYFILSGQVEVRFDHSALTEMVVFTLGPGEVVGEIGVLDGGARTATVVATQTAQTLELTAEQLTDMILRYPSATTALLQTISRRLRTTDELAEHLARKAAAQRGEDSGAEGQ
jgi:CRP/FNR family transcriptional regulator, cyclic AMP receptor protein